jgi:hypothetical protein
MIDNDAHLPLEARLLYALCEVELSPDRLSWCREWLPRNHQAVDWHRFLDLACRHNVLPLIGWQISHHRLYLDEAANQIIPHYWLWAGAYYANRRRNQELWREFQPLIGALSRWGKPFAVRKGFVQTAEFYRDIGLRRMNDLDLLFPASGVGDARTALASAGFAQGRVSASGDRIEPFSRRTQLTWAASLNNLLPFQKLSERLDIFAYIVDVCVSPLPVHRGSDSVVSAMLARRRLVTVDGHEVPALDPVDHLIDLCLHLYKEATALFYIESGKDLQLSKFLDVALAGRAMSRTQSWPQVLSRAAELEVTDEFAAALGYTSALYPDTVTPEVRDALPSMADAAALEYYGQPDGDPRKWRQPFLTRLFDPDRLSEVVSRSRVPRV